MEIEFSLKLKDLPDDVDGDEAEELIRQALYGHGWAEDEFEIEMTNWRKN